MPIVHVNLLAGRSPALKADLAKRVTEAVCEALGSRPEAVRVLLHEVMREDWFVAGEPIGSPAKSEAQPSTPPASGST